MTSNPTRQVKQKKAILRQNNLYFSIWMGIINSVLKRSNLKEFSSFNFYYNCFQKLFSRKESVRTTQQIYSELYIPKKAFDFKTSVLAENEKSKETLLLCPNNS